MITLSPGRLRGTLLLLACVQFTHVMDFMIMMPLGPQLMRAFDLGPELFARLVASYGFSAGVCGFLASFVLDRFDRKRALLLLFAGFAVATAACGLATSYTMLLGARVLAGAFGGVAGSVVTAMVGDVVPPERRGAGMAFVMSGFSLAQIFGVPAGLWLAARADWHMPFFALSGVAVVVNLAGLAVLPRVDAHLVHRGTQSAWQRVREILTQANHLRAFGLVVMLTMSGMIMVPFLATAVVRNGGASEHALTLVYACGGLATLATNNILGRLGDRFGHVRVFDGMALFAIVPVVLVTHLDAWPLWVVLVITTAFIVSMGGRWTPSMALVTMSVEARLRGGFMSLNSAIQAAFGAVASSLSGWIVIEAADGRLERYAWAGWLSLGFLAVGAWLIRRIRVVDAHPVMRRAPEPESGAMD
ncbi:MAG: MFS transporter [Opitutaceae bacterium]|nr:MFS transporter [Opitutaceae bacterium]